MLPNCFRELLTDPCRKGAGNFSRQIGVVIDTRRVQRQFQLGLDIGDQHRKLGTRQAVAVLNHLFIGDIFQTTIELAIRLEAIDQAQVFIQILFAVRLSQTQRLHLAIVIGQHQITDIVGHLLEQGITLLDRHIAVSHDFIDQNFDIDLMVGTVNTASVVDKVGIAGAALKRKLDPTQLGKTEVSALAKHLAAQFRAVDPQAVVGFITNISVGLTTGFNIGADTAVPDQINRRFEQCRDQIIWTQIVLFDRKTLFHLSRDRNRLGRTGKDTAALRDQFGIVVAPG